MYKCDHFKIQELVSPGVYKDRGDKAWELLDDRLLMTLDKLRERYGPIIVNNWANGGDRQWSGFRTPGSPFYSKYSQHSFGRAADCLFSRTTAGIVRQDILLKPFDSAFMLIGAIELGVSWLHFDVRNCDRIKTFRP